MENNIRNTEQNRSRFNIVDGFVLLLIVAVLFAAFYVFDPFDVFVKENEKDVVLSYIVKLEDVDGDVKDNITVGENVHSALTDYGMGKVTDVQVNNAVKWIKSDDSMTMVEVTIEDKYDIYVTIEVECVYQTGIGYVVNGKQIVYGSALELRFSDFIGKGNCVGFSLVD